MLLSLLFPVALSPVAPIVEAPQPHRLAQSIITPSGDATGTVINQQGNPANARQIDIEGGTTAGRNLFHSFEQFTLGAGDIANFLTVPQIDNILGRVDGGQISELNGTLQISGGSANLFLMNPAGIVFGPNAKLNLPAAFTATTGDGIGFETGIFEAFGTNDVRQLVGNPDSILFSTTAAGSIVNQANLSLQPNQLLRLVGSRVLSPGSLMAGQVQVAGVAGSGQFSLSQGSVVLNLASDNLASNADAFAPWEAQSLAELAAGDVAVRSLTAQSASLTAANDLKLEASQLRATENLSLTAGNLLRARDIVANPLVLQSGGTLRLQGNNGIDIFALNHPQTQIQSGSALSLLSNGLISGDAQFFSGGDFRISTLADQPGRFVSLDDPIIRSQSDVSFGDYTGAALKVEAEGSISGGNIRITGPDVSGVIPASDPDFIDLTTRPSLILRAGTPVAVPSVVIASAGDDVSGFEQTTANPALANITVGDIDTSVNGSGERGGNVILFAPGRISAGDIDASAFRDDGLNTFGGNVTIEAGGTIDVGQISTVSENFSPVLARAGNVLISAGEDLLFDTIDARGNSSSAVGTAGEGDGGTVTLSATGLVRGRSLIDFDNTINTTGTSRPGAIAITHGGGADNIPFVVGDAAAENGTAGGLQSGATFILNQSFPNVGREASAEPGGNEVSITFTNQAPTLAGDRTISTEINTVATIAIADLNLNLSDGDNDNAVLEVNSIGAGATLARNGTPLGVGDAIASRDTLTYTPPSGTSGSVLAFSLRGSDRLTTSNAIDITANIAEPVVNPPTPDPNPPVTPPQPPIPQPPIPQPSIPQQPLAPPPAPESPSLLTPEPSPILPGSELPMSQRLSRLSDRLGRVGQAQLPVIPLSLTPDLVEGSPIATSPNTDAQVLSDLGLFPAMLPEASLMLRPQDNRQAQRSESLLRNSELTVNSGSGFDPNPAKQAGVNSPDTPGIGAVRDVVDKDFQPISGPVGDFPGDSGDGLTSPANDAGTTSSPQPGFEPDAPPTSGMGGGNPNSAASANLPGNHPSAGNLAPGQNAAPEGNTAIASATAGESNTGSVSDTSQNSGGSLGSGNDPSLSPSSIQNQSSGPVSADLSIEDAATPPEFASELTSADSSRDNRSSSESGSSANNSLGNVFETESFQSMSGDVTTQEASASQAQTGQSVAEKTAVGRTAQDCAARVAQGADIGSGNREIDSGRDDSAKASDRKSSQQSHYQSLVSCYQKMLAQARQSQDSNSELHALNNLGIAHFVLGDYLQAIAAHQQHLQQAQTQKDSTQIGIALSGLGAAHAALGEYDRAIDEYQQSLEFLPETETVQPWRSLTLRNLGNAYLSKTNYKQALQYQQQALKLSRFVGDRYGEMQALGNLANVYALNSQFETALDYYQQNLSLAQSQNVVLEEAQALLGLGTTHAFLKDYRQAIDYNQKSLALVRSLDNRLSEGIVLTNLGDAHYQLGELSPAERYLRQSIEVWEGLRAGLGTNDSYKISIFETQLAAYRNLQEVLIDQQQPGEALAIAERGRSRAFVELLARGKDSSASAASSFQDASLAPPNLAKLRAIAREQNATVVEYTIAREQFVDVPNGAALQYTGEAVPSKLLIWVLKPSGEVEARQVDLLRWQIEQQQSLPSLVAVARRCMSDVACARTMTGLNRRVLARSLAQRGILQPGPSDNDQAQLDAFNAGSADAQNPLRQLHELLIEPIADVLPQDPSDRIVFVPQEQLFLVPFPALQASDGSYLIDHHTVTTAPAIQVLDATRRRRDQLAQRQDSQKSIEQRPAALVVGNPAPMPEEFSPLPFTAVEAEAIAQSLNAQPLIGPAATEAAIKRQLPQARWIHLATHGIFNPRQPLDGAIILASGADASGLTPSDQDGLLTAGEILDLSLNAEMVVLSACDTGQGRITGDGVVGLSRSFLGAGAASVMVSLWQVPDDATASLMSEFYQQRGKLDYAQALRQAMLTVKADYDDPKSWAGFTLIGEVE